LLESNIYDERALLVKIADGDESAFRQLFHRYNQLLQPFVMKLAGSEQAVEEIIQETFLKIWLYRNKLGAVENPKAYIVRIVSNESLNYLSRLAKEHRLHERMKHASGAGYPSPEQLAVGRETEKLIDEAVEQLPLACQEIYRMSREQDKRIPEIASSLRLSNSTVKNQLVKALRSIRLHIARATPLLLVCFFQKF
jgi:RNA polymerase sigma-70 factor (ECF subfamily)